MKNFVTFGEIMLRLSPPPFYRIVHTRSFDVTFGGAEANVAVSLAQFGLPVEFVTRLPRTTWPTCASTRCARWVLAPSTSSGGATASASITWSFGAAQRGSKVIYDRANSSIATLKPGTIDWRLVFADAGCSTGPASPRPFLRAPRSAVSRPSRLPGRWA